MPGLGGAPLRIGDSWVGAAACMREREDLDRVPGRRDAVVKVIPDASDVNATDTRETDVGRARADSWMRCDEFECMLEVVSQRSGGREAVLSPPFLGFTDRRSGRGRDDDGEHGHERLS